MIIDCPHCEKKIKITSAKPKDLSELRGRDLLNFYIEQSGKKIKTIAKELKMFPGHLSATRKGHHATGQIMARRFAEYFGHSEWRDFLDGRKIY